MAENTRDTLQAVEVGGGYWMLVHTRYGVLMRDLGWFESRDAAESKARQLDRVFGGARRTIVHRFDGSLFN